jgi:hypothetical protein
MPDVQEKFDQLVVPITWNEKVTWNAYTFNMIHQQITVYCANLKCLLNFSYVSCCLIARFVHSLQIYTSVKPLRIGYFTSLAYLPVIGDTEQIVLSAKEALESEGHTLVPFEMPDSFTMARLIADFAYADGGENSLKIW